MYGKELGAVATGRRRTRSLPLPVPYHAGARAIHLQLALADRLRAGSAYHRKKLIKLSLAQSGFREVGRTGPFRAARAAMRNYTAKRREVPLRQSLNRLSTVNVLAV